MRAEHVKDKEGALCFSVFWTMTYRPTYQLSQRVEGLLLCRVHVIDRSMSKRPRLSSKTVTPKKRILRCEDWKFA